ncbi:NADH dehydrogenase [Zhongshania aliphaticivorans]|uniref:NADH dehydrogenase n=1 Tax=Zhongshania aliphaticivorans TaxID=1470434 RepID=A0A5S9NIX1_9GAMM|nr:NAD(P)/FAD-dependent oxidoreductase [Zhongshania aliphaticivorans]CAA0090564.1 NADH dehydrogenase [Zhongshania aliphaticivorans]CAA0098047.1 NADH dehydrogenase [Zhongshania aliphaticivorans]
MNIVIVGGGAGGLPLVTMLGKRLGRKGIANITLVDASASHIWKPRFHEVATGAIDSDLDAVDYRAHAHQNHYHFHKGRMSDLDRDNKEIILEAAVSPDGLEILPERRIPYDYLVITVGSLGNDFNTAGVRDHCLFLDTREQADRFHERFLNHCVSANYYSKPVSVAIVGGGATGVELAAEIHHAIALLKLYGHKSLDRSRLQVHIIEAGPRLLPALSEQIAAAAQVELESMGVQVHTGTMVKQADEQGFITADGERIDAALLVWAAGIKAPEVVAKWGLEVNRINQLMVTPFLQTADEAIFAIGDCCACELVAGKNVPPRAQSAQQMAKHTAVNLQRLIKNMPLKPFKYRDHGSLVSLSGYSALGNLMGSMRSGSFFIEGWMARMMYVSLYRLHQAAIYGWLRTIMLLMAGRFNRLLRPRLKLH